jgi:hypothetical protein
MRFLADIPVLWIVAAILFAWLLRSVMGWLKGGTWEGHLAKPRLPEQPAAPAPASQELPLQEVTVAQKAAAQSVPQQRKSVLATSLPVAWQLCDATTLRRAFVWQEILGPPVTLRRDGEGGLGWTFGVNAE